MSLPKSVQIGHRVYDIKIKSGIKHEEYGSVDGWISIKECEIYIEKELPLYRKKSTLVHEIMHGIFDFLGEREVSERGDDERRTEAMTNMLILLFKDNPNIGSIFK